MGRTKQRKKGQEEAGGEVRARAGPGGAGRGAQGRRAEGETAWEESARREEGGTGRETGGADTATSCGTGGVWPTGQASGSIMGWRGLRRQGEYYGLEQPWETAGMVVRPGSTGGGRKGCGAGRGWWWKYYGLEASCDQRQEYYGCWQGLPVARGGAAGWHRLHVTEGPSWGWRVGVRRHIMG